MDDILFTAESEQLYDDYDEEDEEDEAELKKKHDAQEAEDEADAELPPPKEDEDLL